MKQELFGDKIGKNENKEELISRYLQFFIDTFGKDIKENITENFTVRN